MSLTTLIADTRKAIADDTANAQAVFAAQGTLVGVTEVDVRTGAHAFSIPILLKIAPRTHSAAGSRSK